MLLLNQAVFNPLHALHEQKKRPAVKTDNGSHFMPYF